MESLVGPLDRGRRFELLAALPEGEASRLAGEALRLAGTEVSVVVPPTVGMLMARAADGARGERFNLAEVLVTEARVALGGHEGWGMVMGRRPEHALAVAILDAAAEVDAGARRLVDGALLAQAQRAGAARAGEWASLAPTRVDFEISN